jgi:multimeric flavodoxin WrbA
MKILGVCGSLREESNTNKIVKKVAESSGNEFELVYLSQLSISPCTGCLLCTMNEGQCVIDDGMQGIYSKLMDAGAIIVGAPTYYMDISGAAKCFIDRSMAIFYRGIGPDAELEVLGKRPLAGRPAVAVTTVAGSGHERAIETLRVFLEINKMNIVALLAEVVGMKDVDDMPEALKRAENAGKKLGKILKQDR